MRIARSCLIIAAPFLLGVSPALAAQKACPGNDKALGVSRVVEIDTTGGPGFGLEHYKAYDFLRPGEIVLTFDDGPLPTHTRTVLKALKAHCTKATFFPVGKLVVGYPNVLKEVMRGGHTIGGHTWSHPNLSKKKIEKAKEEIETGLSAIKIALGKPTASFFRFPYLKDTDDLMSHLGKRNIGVFSTDLDSFDFKIRKPKTVEKRPRRRLRRASAPSSSPSASQPRPFSGFHI